MPISYISEHTTEFILVPKLMELVKIRYTNVVPVYFWATREGNNLSRELHRNMNVKIIAFFPRRPKLDNKNPELIYGKINSLIFEFANFASSLYIPTIAGLPIADSLLDLSQNPSLCWFHISKSEPKDITFEINKHNKEIIFHNNENGAIKVLVESNFDSIIEKSKLYNWEDAIDNLRLLKPNNYSNRIFSHFNLWGIYRPIFLFAFD